MTTRYPKDSTVGNFLDEICIPCSECGEIMCDGWCNDDNENWEDEMELSDAEWADDDEWYDDDFDCVDDVGDYDNEYAAGCYYCLDPLCDGECIDYVDDWDDYDFLYEDEE